MNRAEVERSPAFQAYYGAMDGLQAECADNPVAMKWLSQLDESFGVVWIELEDTAMEKHGRLIMQCIEATGRAFAQFAQDCEP